jgi:hypothetical protein
MFISFNKSKLRLKQAKFTNPIDLTTLQQKIIFLIIIYFYSLLFIEYLFF